MILLQIVSDTTALQPVDQSISILDLAIKGGVVMIPLAILWVIAVYVFVERLITINKAGKIPESFMMNVKDLVLKGDVNGAKLVCSQYDTPIARIIEKGLQRVGKPIERIE